MGDPRREDPEVIATDELIDRLDMVVLREDQVVERLLRAWRRAVRVMPFHPTQGIASIERRV